VNNLPNQFKVGPFNFETSLNKTSTIIKMVSNTSKFYSSDYKKTSGLLWQELPEIFTCKCFNGFHRSFFEEVRDTEMAHLFEHIFIQYFCNVKSATAEVECECSGETVWNWDQDVPGTFFITIDVGSEELDNISKALAKTMVLFEKIVAKPEREGILFPDPEPVLVPVPAYLQIE